MNFQYFALKGTWFVQNLFENQVWVFYCSFYLICQVLPFYNISYYCAMQYMLGLMWKYRYDCCLVWNEASFFQNDFLESRFSHNSISNIIRYTTIVRYIVKVSSRYSFQQVFSNALINLIKYLIILYVPKGPKFSKLFFPLNTLMIPSYLMYCAMTYSNKSSPVILCIGVVIISKISTWHSATRL